MVALQVPRLTTTLRAFHSGEINSGILDTDKAYIERKEILETIRLTRSAVASVGSSDLAKKLLISWDLAPITIRHAYEQFLKIVEELIGGEVQSEELYSAASIVYDVLHDLDTSCSGRALQEAVSKKAEQLVAIFGAVTKNNIAGAAEIVRKLHDWRASIGGDSLSIAAHSDEAAEFGAEISFQLPTSRDLDAGAVTMPCLGARNERPYNFDHGSHAQKLEVNHTEVDLKWLRNACKKVSLEGSSFCSDELAITICNLLESNNSGDEIAGSLFDLMGDQEFELIQVILQHRKELVELLHKGLSFLKSKKLGQNLQNRMPSYGVQVSIQTGSDRQVEKLRRKEEKKHSRSNNAVGESGLEWLAENGGFSALVDCIETMNGGLDSLIGTGDANLSGTAIPQGSTRKNFKGYEEVHVPAAPTASLKPHERLVKISEIDEFAQVAFDGYKTLNRIQSRIFPTAYTSNENILVCAPTGAGKTNIAMITVLREIQQHMKYGILQKNEFKIVYVAPMKALAAEVTVAFSRRLAPLNVIVKELTGDMQLTKRELEETQMIVTTPEKWDVITRKTSDMALATLVKLLIIDEVHLLNDDRGPVIESLVARTLRQVESSQSMIRIVGLSATLPNYLEVARFLRVNPDTGLFHFDASYRPVPLTQQYIGITESNFVVRNNLMNEICYKKVLEAVNHGHQAMVFVHSRKDTVKTARVLVELAQRNDELERFENVEHPLYTSSKKEISKSRNKEIGELFLSGFGVHHAGMLRSDRALTEKLFSEGLIKVLVCTATLAWGVNLPAHTVIIKGTQLYDPKAGGWRELSMLDVMQIFGRAGRPQFDTSGEGIIITAHNKLAHYLRLLTHQSPIESQFIHSLKDNLNAEIVLGTVTNVREASIWLGYTYLFVRMSSNPLVYGMSWEELLRDTDLVGKRHALITDAARALDRAKMLRFDEKSGNFYVTDLGRVASHYYLQYTSVETYNEMLKQHMSDSELFKLISHSSEFENIIVREEEQQELSNLLHDVCPLEISSSPEDKYTKINILIQVYISRGHVEGFSLVADSAYISASLGRIMRSLFEICLRRGWCSMTALLLEYCKAVDHRIWPHQHPLRQFEAILSHEILHKLEDRCASMDRLYDMDEKEMGALIRNPYGGKVVAQCMENFPSLLLAANISPITRTVLQVALTITPNFTWKERFHGASLRWWIWVEDSENEHIYHSDLVIITKKMVAEGGQTITFAIPIFEPLPSQYYVRAVSDSWLQASTLHVLSFQHLILPEMHPPHTELLNLRPLPISALGNKIYEDRYKFSFFNPIQTQTFHILYHTDHNVLLGAPTGSGKTISAELAMLHLFNNERDMKVVYIAPLKALVRERVDDWKRNLVPILGKKLVELTGDFTPDLLALLEADVIISTPEKWDGISRNWHDRDYVKKVGLMIFDEIHLLGGDRGPVLEVIVSRMRYISSQTECPIRFVGLSTALANARDLANWLGVEDVGLFNFKPSVRPVPLEVHIQGFPGKFYCPRMNSMNKPTYAAIRTHSPVKPVLIFVSSRRQTRLTALDLIQFAAADEQPKQFLNMSEEEIDVLISQLGDDNLKHTLQFGIGLHHAGLNDKDRTLVEELFVNTKIQVLVCTSTLAWGVNFPAHLVVIKGTEYYDGKTKRYVDYPITDVLQMMGRAGRPQYDQYGKAVILVHEPKKSFYKKFLYEPFPVESSLMNQIHDHINAEVSAGTITSKQDAVDYLTWTYLFRRLVVNPSYYGLERSESGVINSFLSNLVTVALQELEVAGCIRVNEDHTVDSLMLGFVASQYYLHYMTVALFSKKIGADSTLEELLYVLSSAAEYNELPVRHNEDKLNELLAREVRVPVDLRAIDDPHVKTNLLLQAHFSRIELPVSDYITDTKSVLDQSIRIVQAMVDVAANGGWLKTAMHSMYLLQMVMQGIWWNDSHLWMLPHVNSDIINVLASSGISSIGQLLACSVEDLRRLLHKFFSQSQLSELIEFLRRLPRIETNYNTTLNGSTQIVEIQLRRINKTYRGRALLPRFPKTKQEGWWLILGSRDTWELHGIKRVSFTNYLKTRLIVPTIRAPEKLSLYLVSDCYLGLDQEHILS